MDISAEMERQIAQFEQVRQQYQIVAAQRVQMKQELLETREAIKELKELPEGERPDILVLAVKPQQSAEVLAEIQPNFTPRRPAAAASVCGPFWCWPACKRALHSALSLGCATRGCVRLARSN